MIIPPLQGKLEQDSFFIYAAADRGYFEQFGRALINSIVRNAQDTGIHLHLYNPTSEQVEFCQRSPRVSVTWETFTTADLRTAIDYWSRTDLSEPDASRRTKMLCMKQFADSDDVARWIHKTYYACMRFVRLAELIDQPQRFLAIDVDGLVRKNFAQKFADDQNYDFYLYQKMKKGQPSGHLAGSILYTEKPAALDLIKLMGNKIRNEITKDNIYWFLDQHVLDEVAAKYRRGLLPIDYIDWHMKPDSAIWTAKGKRKELEVFKNELRKYA